MFTKAIIEGGEKKINKKRSVKNVLEIKEKRANGDVNNGRNIQSRIFGYDKNKIAKMNPKRT